MDVMCIGTARVCFVQQQMSRLALAGQAKIVHYLELSRLDGTARAVTLASEADK